MVFECVGRSTDMFRANWPALCPQAEAYTSGVTGWHHQSIATFCRGSWDVSDGVHVFGSLADVADNSLLGNVSAISSLAWGATGIFFAAATINNPDFIPTVYEKFGLYVGILVLCGFLCAYGTTLFARLQTPSVILNVLLTLVTVIGLPIARRHDLNTAQFTFGHFENLTGCECDDRHMYTVDYAHTCREQRLCIHPKFSCSSLDDLQFRLRRVHIRGS